MKSSLRTIGEIMLTIMLTVFLVTCKGGEDIGGGDSDTTSPTAPTNLTATAVSNSQIDLSWTASKDDVGVTGYKVYREGSEIVSTTATSYSDTGLTFNTTYCYTVKAYDAAENISDDQPEACATTFSNGADTTAPTSPTDLTTTAVSNSQIDLSWTASTDDVGVTGYKVYRFGEDIGSATTNFYSDTELTFDTDYCYTVRAYDAAGNISADQAGPCARTNVGYDGIKWKYDTGNGIYYSSPAIATDGTIYVGNNTALYAINADGTLKWKYDISSPVYTPAVGANGTIYVQDATSTLYALNVDGTEKWRYTLSASHAVGQSTPAIDSDGTIYIGADAVYAINPDGTLKWSYSPPGNEYITIIHSSPVIASDGTIFVGANGNFWELESSGLSALFALNPDGTLKWRYIFESSDWVFSSPAIDSDGTVYIGSEKGSFVHAINPDGTLEWRYEIGEGRQVRASPAVDIDGTIYVATKVVPNAGELLALNPDGTLKWSQTFEAEIYCSPTIGDDGLIYFAPENGIFYAINPDGTENWKYATNNGLVWSSPAIGEDGSVYIGNLDGYLFVLNSSSQGLVNSPWPKFRHDNQNTGRFSP